MTIPRIGIGALALLITACTPQPEARDWTAESKAMFAWVEKHATSSVIARNFMRDRGDKFGFYLVPFDAFDGVSAPDLTDSGLKLPRNALNLFNGEGAEIAGDFTPADIDKTYVGVMRMPASCEARTGAEEDQTAPTPAAPSAAGDSAEAAGCEAAKVLLMAHLRGDTPTRFYVLPLKDFNATEESTDLPLLLGRDPMDVCGFAAKRGSGNGSLEDDAIGICKGRLRAAAAFDLGLTLELDAVTQGGLSRLAGSLAKSELGYFENQDKATYVWDFSQTEVKGERQ